MRSSFLIVAAVATLAACTESPTQTADHEPNFAKSENAQGRVVGSASGSGQSLCTPDGVDCRAEVQGQPLTERYDVDEKDLTLRTFSFTAQLLEDGTARGKAQFNNRGRDHSWDLDISCVAFNLIVPNQVWFGGTLTRGYGQADAPGGLPYEVGAEVMFAVEDNGEGSGADPDRIIGIGTTPPGFAGAVCAGFVPWEGLSAFFEGANFDPIRGNIQVRPPSAG
jgi:hypothetical protein